MEEGYLVSFGLSSMCKADLNGKSFSVLFLKIKTLIFPS